MWIKKIIALVFILFLLNIAQGVGINNSIGNQTTNINSSISSTSANENTVYGANQLTDTSLRNLELEQELLVQNQKTYDSFLNTALLALTLFGLVLTIVLAISGFLFHKNISDVKMELKNDITEFKEKIKNDVQNDLSVKAELLTEKIMKSNYEKRVTKLENYVQELKKAVDKGKKLPEFFDENEIVEKEQPSKNIFDET